MEAGGEAPPPTSSPPSAGRGRRRRITAPSVLGALLALLVVSVSGAGVTDGPGRQRHPPRRLKRGWLWSQLVVPEEDPTPRVIGRVRRAKRRRPSVLKSDYINGEFTVRYILSGEGAGDAFQIDEYSGEIRTCRTLDREEKAFYVLQAQAINRFTNEPVEPQSEFIIKVQDINDNAPVFQGEPYVSSIPEMSPTGRETHLVSPTGTTVARVTATDADDPQAGNNALLLYSILQGEPYFSVEPKTGLIVTSWPNMDREARDEYLVVVEVRDMLGQRGAHSASATVTVHLTDVNDNGPTFQHHLYTFGVREDAAVGATVGRVKADDGDVGLNARMNYTLQDLEESQTFTIQLDPDTQEGLILLAKPLDYESKSRFVMAVEADNELLDERFLRADEARDRATVKVFVEDVDEPPVFAAAAATATAAYQWKVAENAAPGSVVGAVSARDTDARNNPVRYSIERRSDIRAAFRIDPNNGTVTLGARPLDREAADWHNVTVVATETSKEENVFSPIQSCSS
ncbi:Cadherin-7 [Merluccius polli]|uniref:Cadherin-7 n=1 Tax=Merluccius polli TaxID=89951 RepID=A0AA47N5U0_MERPO|nr:Cadherin-7 [Merluccius polli]